VKYNPDESKHFSDEEVLVEKNNIVIDPHSTDLINSCKEKMSISSVVVRNVVLRAYFKVLQGSVFHPSFSTLLIYRV